MPDLVKVPITYFKPSGKYKYSGHMELPRNLSVYKGMIDFEDLRIRHKLPGLESGQWDGHIHIDFSLLDQGYPVLIPARKLCVELPISFMNAEL